MLPPVRLPIQAVAIAFLLAVVPAFPAAAQSGGDEPKLHELRFNATRDGIITGAAGVLWISSEAIFKDSLAPAECRWCDRAPDGTDRLNRLDRWGRGLVGTTEASRTRAHQWSNVIGFAALPVGLLGFQYAIGRDSGAPTRFFAEDATIIVQSTAIAALANQTVKFIAGRERPFVHVLPEDQKALTAHPSDNNLSFYSGHASLAFSLVVSTGTVASLRGYKHQAWIWGVGLPLATSVGLLRMRADKHYLSDVATGALLGSAIGFAVPMLLHGRKGDASPSAQASAVQVTPVAGARMAGLSGTF
ncbi:PAP2 family protein [Myxococcus hansupus]|uniref:PAP2 family protein n=1 Tax=Pseudomyxococcus hansupus TaxID=1297742 RepID=A0A0H4XH42_9BACT|nr:PAP2 family protein [Myxococcus hansupus]